MKRQKKETKSGESLSGQMAWNKSEQAALRRLRTPREIQSFIDDLTYSVDNFTRSARGALALKRAHCFDGALVAAAALEFHGERPLLLDLRAVRDEDHVLAVYKRGKHFGAIAKSKFSGLRFREAVYSSVRELALSYFEHYFNFAKQKTLREFSVPLDLTKVTSVDWRFSHKPVDVLADTLDALPHTDILTPEMARSLSRVDDNMFRAGAGRWTSRKG